MLRIRFALLLITAWVLAVNSTRAQTQEKPAGDASSTALTEPQQQAVQQALRAADTDGKTKAAPAILRVGPVTRAFDRNILSEKPDPEVDHKLAADLAEAVVQAVSSAIEAKLAGVREIVKILTPAQKKALLAELEKPDSNPDLTELVLQVLGKKK